MDEIILADGPPPLTRDAADASLDAIGFIASVVPGQHAIYVTDVLRMKWRTWLAAYYSQFSFETRQWFANAPQFVIHICTPWPTLAPSQRDALVKDWCTSLPSLMSFLEPVLAAASREAERSSFGDANKTASDILAEVITSILYMRHSMMMTTMKNIRLDGGGAPRPTSKPSPADGVATAPVLLGASMPRWAAPSDEFTHGSSLTWRSLLKK